LVIQLFARLSDSVITLSHGQRPAEIAILAGMKKFFLMFLLVLLPLQYAQAAVCAYCCEDEVPMSSQGTHDQQQIVAVDDAPIDSAGEDHHACGSCHLSCCQYLSSQSVVILPFKVSDAFHHLTTGYQSYIPHGLDRPNWTHLA